MTRRCGQRLGQHRRGRCDGIAVLANDLSRTEDVLRRRPSSGLSTLGKLTVNSDGTVQYDPKTSALLQALNAGALTDTFTYSALDQHGAPAGRSAWSFRGAAEPPAADGEVFEDGSRRRRAARAGRRGSNGNLTSTVTGSGRCAARGLPLPARQPGGDPHRV
jgi:VCBS repeat-containing protein